MSTTVYTEDGTFTWLNDYDNEKVDTHAHVSDDLVIPVTLKKTLTQNENYIACTDANDVFKFKLQGDGTLYVSKDIMVDKVVTDDIDIMDGALLAADAALGFVPYDANGNAIADREFRFGRNKDIGDFSHEGDGLQFYGKYPKNNVDKDCAVQIGIGPSEPSVSIKGFKNSGEHFFEVKDEEDGLVFAIGDNGHILGSYILDPTNAKDSYNASSVHSSESVYIGPSRLSYTSGKLRFYKLKNTIPTILAASPYNVSSIPAAVSNSDDKIHEWMHVARTIASDNTVTVSSVFPAGNLASDFDEVEFAEADDVYTKNEVDQDITTLETAIALNTAKTGITPAQTAAIVLNTAKTGISTAQAAEIVVNNAKTGITPAQTAAIVLNTAKTGITAGQTTAITANSIKYTQAQVDTALALKSTVADPSLTGNLNLENASSDCIINIKRTGHAAHYIKSHSDDKLIFGVDGGSNNGGKLTIHDNKNIDIYGHVNIPTSYEYRINGTALAKGDVGLGSVDNVADDSKPVSTAQQTALDLKANLAGPTFSAGMTLTKTVHGSALEWSSHQQLITVTIDDVRSGSIPVFSSFNMSGVQRFFLELTSNQISAQSVVVVHTWSPNGYENWLPQVSNLRTRYNSGGNTFRATFAVSGTHSMSGNSTTNLFVNYVIL